MKKNIIMVVLVVLAITSMVYAFFQQTAASKARIEAENNLVLAVAAQHEADRQGAIAQEELAKCKGKK